MLKDLSTKVLKAWALELKARDAEATQLEKLAVLEVLSDRMEDGEYEIFRQMVIQR
jgi:hypothetical protein